jgi:hypothetical protein
MPRAVRRIAKRAALAPVAAENASRPAPMIAGARRRAARAGAATSWGTNAGRRKPNAASLPVARRPARAEKRTACARPPRTHIAHRPRVVAKRVFVPLTTACVWLVETTARLRTFARGSASALPRTENAEPTARPTARSVNSASSTASVRSCATTASSRPAPTASEPRDAAPPERAPSSPTRARVVSARRQAVSSARMPIAVSRSPARTTRPAGRAHRSVSDGSRAFAEARLPSRTKRRPVSQRLKLGPAEEPTSWSLHGQPLPGLLGNRSLAERAITPHRRRRTHADALPRACARSPGVAAGRHRRASRRVSRSGRPPLTRRSPRSSRSTRLPASPGGPPPRPRPASVRRRLAPPSPAGRGVQPPRDTPRTDQYADRRPPSGRAAAADQHADQHADQYTN